ncbi:MAG: hypothetical protein DSY42_04745 [Aquifex sp.]|nr:MAG: hypothetical protein DSY42_04745 [Aquifex sp.]
MILHYKEYYLGEIYELDSGLEGKPVDTKESLIDIHVNDKGEVVYLWQELVGDRWEGNFEVLEEILEKIKPEGLYIVPELGLKNVPFYKVIKAIKERFLKEEKVLV